MMSSSENMKKGGEGGKGVRVKREGGEKKGGGGGEVA